MPLAKWPAALFFFTVPAAVYSCLLGGSSVAECDVADECEGPIEKMWACTTDPGCNSPMPPCTSPHFNAYQCGCAPDYFVSLCAEFNCADPSSNTELVTPIVPETLDGPGPGLAFRIEHMETRMRNCACAWGRCGTQTIDYCGAAADTAENDCYCNGVGCESQPTAAAAAAEMVEVRAPFGL